MKKRYLSALLVCLMMFSVMASPAYSAENSSNKAKVQKLVEKRIVQGDEFGNLHLDQKITRSEFVKIMVYALGHEAEAKRLQNTHSIYNDITPNHWANGVIQVASTVKMLTENYLLNGYPDGSFKPSKTITNVEILKILVLASNSNLIEEAKEAQWTND